MKKSIIRDIFNGFRGNMQTMNKPKSKDDLENDEIICDTYDELEKKLSPEQMNLHKKFVDALEKDFGDDIDFYFVEGFKLGLLIGIECKE